MTQNTLEHLKKYRLIILCLLLTLVAWPLFVLPPTAARQSSLPLTLTLEPPRSLNGTDRQSVDPDLRTRFEPGLLKKLLTGSEDEPLRVIVVMHGQLALDQSDLGSLDVLTRRQAIVQRLQSAADVAQRDLLSTLEIARQERRIANYRPLWIVNGIAVQGPKDVLWELAARPDVAFILEDQPHVLTETGIASSLSLDKVARSSSGDATYRTQWNISRIQADRAWESLGITGQGVVVASMDTGVDWQHPDLMTRYRGYTGKPLAEHAGNWFCATDEGYEYPGDGSGHGTHTMGIIIGQNGIGVAPGAKWIAVKVFNNQNLAYDSWIHAGFQWLLAPNGDPALAPDLVNNSWGSKASGDERFLSDIQALRLANIALVFSAGNEGPDSGSVTAPGSLRESLTVGATDQDDRVALFSGRGPSPWQETKPEVCAPGVNIESAAPGGGRKLMSGTSMAAPHVAGLAALLLQANPSLTVDQVESILTETALPLGEGHPNNECGWGLVNAYAAVVRAGRFGQLQGVIADSASGSPIADAAVQVVSRSTLATTQAETDAAGYFSMGLSADTYDVTVSAFGYVGQVASHIKVVTGTTTTLDISLTPLPTGLLRGVVRESGAGNLLPAAVFVPHSPAITTAGTDGAYSLTLPQGTHTVRVEAAAHRVATATVTITEGAITLLDFALDAAPTILLVDSGAWYNDSQRQFYQSALDGLGYLYDLRTIEKTELYFTGVPTAGTFLPYDLVIWSAPQDAPGYIGATEAITTYLKGGGRLLLSGQDVAFWDGGGNGLFHAPYLKDYLKTSFVRDTATSRTLIGQGVFAGLSVVLADSGPSAQWAPDVITFTNADYTALAWTYLADELAGQMVGTCLPYRALVFGFGLEGIADDLTRQEVLARSIAWLMLPPQPSGMQLTLGAMPQIAPATNSTAAGSRITHTLRLRNLSQVSTDTVQLSLTDNAWPTTLLNPAPMVLGMCQTATLHVAVDIPAGIGWNVYDTATLAVASTLSPGLAFTASLVSKTPAPVLLVDGDLFYDMEEYYEDALDKSNIPYDYHRVKEKWPYHVPATDTLAMYPMIIWYTGYDWYAPLSDAEEMRLLAYLADGGRVFFSGQDFLYYGHAHPLARDYFGVLDYTEDLSATMALGEPGHPIGWGLGPYTLTYPFRNWSDSLAPGDGVQVFMRNQHELPIGLTNVGNNWRTAFASFPFETLDADAAAQVMARTMGWLSWLGASTWSADRQVVEAGSDVTWTGILRNDGWTAVTARLSATLPAELSLVGDSLSPGVTYDPATRAVRWDGQLVSNAAATVSFRTRIADGLPASTTISFPAYIGYDEHQITFERPLILRVNAPDLSTSVLSIEPASGLPSRTLTCTVAVHNWGVRDAVVVITATAPAHAILAGSLDSGGIGMGTLVSQSLTWTGPVAAGGTAILRYHLVLDGESDYLLHHQVHVSDQDGERWLLERWVPVWLWKEHFPQVYKRYVQPSPTPTPKPSLPTPTSFIIATPRCCLTPTPTAVNEQKQLKGGG